MSETAIVIPVRGKMHGKSRLAAVLDPDERSRIVGAMAEHVLGIVLRTVPDARVIVVTRDREVDWLPAARDPRVEMVVQAEGSWGLNAALDTGREVAQTSTPDRLMVLSADLPMLMEDDLASLLDPATDVTIATDKAGDGTNALLLSGQVAIEQFPFHFGEESRRRHEEGTLSLGLMSTTISTPGLRLDLDTPDDWAGLPASLRSRLLAGAKPAGRSLMLETA